MVILLCILQVQFGSSFLPNLRTRHLDITPPPGPPKTRPLTFVKSSITRPRYVWLCWNLIRSWTTLARRRAAFRWQCIAIAAFSSYDNIIFNGWVNFRHCSTGVQPMAKTLCYIKPLAWAAHPYCVAMVFTGGNRSWVLYSCILPLQHCCPVQCSHNVWHHKCCTVVVAWSTTNWPVFHVTVSRPGEGWR